MAKSKNKLEGEQASIKAITMMGEYATADTPTRTELEDVAAVLQTANGKYHVADTDHAGEIDPDEFLKVVKNLSSVLLELEEYDDALAVLGDALNVTSLKAAKEAEINELIVTVAFGKANALTNSGGNPDDIIGVANIGLAKANDEGLHFLKARAHLEKRELAEAIDEFAHVKDSTAVQIADYANKTAKALII